ncbi:MAG: hypothetical protein H3C34_24605, partial [Caldilineaceae bacterium]|nr:hypothetical protein [Caldilineaceae bacterium]
RRSLARVHLLLLGRLAASFLLAFVLLGGSAVNGLDQTWRSLSVKVQNWDWDLLAWEIGALKEKAFEQVSRPALTLDRAQQAALVRSYSERAQQIATLEGKIDALFSASDGQVTVESQALQDQLTALRQEQAAVRTQVEQIIELQISHELAQEGIGIASLPFPPVLFTFTEPPKKLVVSPRGRIDTVYYAMLQPDLPAAEREAIEETILADDNFSAYIANIGGLGAFPTQVIDRAPVDWILTTVAHEWVHNYLSLFPLGLNYSTSADLTILNETVADIVGDEIGLRALRSFYPDLAAAHAATTGSESAGEAADEKEDGAFNFRKEMRHTREIVDQFLALGRIRDAEEYMEIRRILFNENGYPLRKLNQAYFAFHGSYGTSAAATSPIGPKLEQLRTLVPDVETFLAAVRTFTAPEDLDRTLQEWEARHEGVKAKK